MQPKKERKKKRLNKDIESGVGDLMRTTHEFRSHCGALEICVGPCQANEFEFPNKIKSSIKNRVK